MGKAEYSYDLLVIGTGPAGNGAAMAAVKSGLNVGMVERHDMLGGNCAHKGTVPSKTLRHAVKQLIRYNSQK